MKEKRKLLLKFYNINDGLAKIWEYIKKKSVSQQGFEPAHSWLQWLPIILPVWKKSNNNQLFWLPIHLSCMFLKCSYEFSLPQDARGNVLLVNVLEICNIYWSIHSVHNYIPLCMIVDSSYLVIKYLSHFFCIFFSMLHYFAMNFVPSGFCWREKNWNLN